MIIIYENIVSKVTCKFRRTLVYNSLFCNEALEIKGFFVGNLSILLLFLDLADFHLNDSQDVFIADERLGRFPFVGLHGVLDVIALLIAL